MAKRQSTSIAVRGRRRVHAPARSPGPGNQPLTGPADGRAGVELAAAAKDHGLRRSLEEILQYERNRLARAESVLGCLHVALLYANQRSLKECPDFASAAEIVLRLLKEASEGLDSVYVRPVLGPSPRRGGSRRVAEARS